MAQHDFLASVHCASCGYDITSISEGTACSECGTVVCGLERREAIRALASGLTLVLWTLPMLIAVVVLTPIVGTMVQGDAWSPSTNVARVRTLLTLPALALLAGLLVAVTRGPKAARPHPIVVVGLLAALAIACLRAASSFIWQRYGLQPLGFDASGQPVGSVLTTNSVTWGVEWAQRIVGPLLLGAAALWLLRVSQGLGLRTWLSPLGALILVTLLVAVACWCSWWSDDLARNWPRSGPRPIPSLPPGVAAPGTGQNAMRANPELPTYAVWINPQSVAAVLRLAYACIVGIALYLWVVAFGARERLRLILQADAERRVVPSRPSTSAS